MHKKIENIYSGSSSWLSAEYADQCLILKAGAYTDDGYCRNIDIFLHHSDDVDKIIKYLQGMKNRMIICEQRKHDPNYEIKEKIARRIEGLCYEFAEAGSNLDMNAIVDAVWSTRV